MRLKPSLIGLVALAGVSSVWAQPGGAKPPAACFNNRDVSNFVAVDDRTVNIRVGVSRFYRLALFAPCTGVTFVQTIALVSRPGPWICAGEPNPADLLIHTSIGRRRCPVTTITPLTPADVAALPRKQKP